MLVFLLSADILSRNRDKNNKKRVLFSPLLWLFHDDRFCASRIARFNVLPNPVGGSEPDAGDFPALQPTVVDVCSKTLRGEIAEARCLF